MKAGARGGAAGSMCTITTQKLHYLLKAPLTQQLASQQHSLHTKAASLAEAASKFAQGGLYCAKAAGICFFHSARQSKGKTLGILVTPCTIHKLPVCH